MHLLLDLVMQFIHARAGYDVSGYSAIIPKISSVWVNVFTLVIHLIAEFGMVLWLLLKWCYFCLQVLTGATRTIVQQPSWHHVNSTFFSTLKLSQRTDLHIKNLVYSRLHVLPHSQLLNLTLRSFSGNPIMEIHNKYVHSVEALYNVSFLVFTFFTLYYYTLYSTLFSGTLTYEVFFQSLSLCYITEIPISVQKSIFRFVFGYWWIKCAQSFSVDLKIHGCCEFDILPRWKQIQKENKR